MFIPYYIFINGIAEKSDQEVLNLLGLGEGKLVPNWWEDNSYDEETLIYIYRDKGWIHIMDNECAICWYSFKFKKNIQIIAKEYELCACYFGDVDRCFYFIYYKKGLKNREYFVDSPNCDDQVILNDYGIPLEGESEALGQKEHWDQSLYMAICLGINPLDLINEGINNPEKINCYTVDISLIKN